jgi:hypothetical protein
MGALYAWVFVPFRRAEILVEVRFPGQPSFRKSTSFMRSSTSTKTRNFPARI